METEDLVKIGLILFAVVLFFLPSTRKRTLTATYIVQITYHDGKKKSTASFRGTPLSAERRMMLAYGSNGPDVAQVELYRSDPTIREWKRVFVYPLAEPITLHPQKEVA